MDSFERLMLKIGVIFLFLIMASKKGGLVDIGTIFHPAR